MKKILIAFICLCLVATSLAGCATKTEKRSKEIVKELESDKVELTYVSILTTQASSSDYRNEYNYVNDGRYLFSTGDYIYTYEHTEAKEIIYNIVRSSLNGAGAEVVCSVARDDEFEGILMVSPDCYYRYKIIEVYDDPAHGLLGWPTSYIYQWYKFNLDGTSEPTALKYEVREKYIGVEDEYNEMVEDSHNKFILSHLGRRSDSFIKADGIISSLVDRVAENEHDTFEFTKICGYNPESKSALLHFYYRISEGNKLIGGELPDRLEIIFLLDGNTGETHYVGEYDEFFTEHTSRIVPIN